MYVIMIQLAENSLNSLTTQPRSTGRISRKTESYAEITLMVPMSPSLTMIDALWVPSGLSLTTMQTP